MSPYNEENLAAFTSYNRLSRVQSILAQTRRHANDAIPRVQLSSTENALTCECGEFDESTGASYVENDHCYRLGAVSRTAEGFLGPAEGFA